MQNYIPFVSSQFIAFNIRKSGFVKCSFASLVTLNDSVVVFLFMWCAVID